MRQIIYTCDYCVKRVSVRLENKEIEHNPLNSFGQYEICDDCLILAQKNLKHQVYLKILKK